MPIKTHIRTDCRYKPITALVKYKIVIRLRKVPPDTMLGMAFQNFAKNSRFKTDEDYQDLLFLIYSQIKEDSLVTRKVLGMHYLFFKNLFF